MKVQELIDKLREFPPEADVRIAIGGKNGIATDVADYSGDVPAEVEIRCR